MTRRARRPGPAPDNGAVTGPSRGPAVERREAQRRGGGPRKPAVLRRARLGCGPRKPVLDRRAGFPIARAAQRRSRKPPGASRRSILFGEGKKGQRPPRASTTGAMSHARRPKISLSSPRIAVRRTAFFQNAYGRGPIATDPSVGHGVWVPAFAGTTIKLSPTSETPCRNAAATRAPGRRRRSCSSSRPRSTGISARDESSR